MSRLFLLLAFLLLVCLPVQGAVSRARPYTGCGVVLIRPWEQDTPTRIVLYREEGVGRVADLAPAELPLLTQIMTTGTDEYAAAVIRARGNWLQIAYDDGGRLGWIEIQRRWTYSRWEDLLPGHTVLLLPGLRKGDAALRSAPSSSTGILATLAAGEEVRAERMEGDWLQVQSPSGRSGWIRWRDDGGRFLVRFPTDQQQKR